MKKVDKSIIVTSIIAGTVLLVVILVILFLKPASPYSGKTVTVEGSSTIKATPDLIGVYFTIQTKNQTSSEAKSANDEIYNNLVSELVVLGFEESDLKTESFSIYPNVYWQNNQQKEDGFVAYHYLKLELSTEQADKLSGVIDAGVNSGAGINYINFELTEESQNLYKAQALEKASADARIKAEAVALGLNKNVGRLISVQVSDFGYYPWPLYSARAETGAVSSDEISVAKDSVASISPGDQDINAIVSATFRLR